jgi:hypothetical protein
VPHVKLHRRQAVARRSAPFNTAQSFAARVAYPSGLKMKHPFPTAVAIFLIALLSHPAEAQAPVLTNADVVHLVAMRVSDQTVIAVVQEAVATQFDLSPQAASELAGQGVSGEVIGSMRQAQASPRSTTPSNSAASEPPAGGQTLAGAAAEAAAATQTRSLVASASVERPPPAIAAAATVASGAASASAPDESYWRARVAPLHRTLRDNRAKEGPLLNRLNGLTAEASLIRPSDVKRRGVEIEKQKAATDLTALRELLRADLAAIQVLEEEGRRAGVPPAWLR